MGQVHHAEFKLRGKNTDRFITVKKSPYRVNLLAKIPP